MNTSRVMEFVLDFLQGSSEAFINLAETSTLKYGGRKRLAKIAAGRGFRFEEQWSDLYRNRQKFYNLLNHLKSQGLVEAKKHGRTSFWKITKKGEEKLLILRERNLYGKKSADYGAGQADTFKIISYDIPANENRKRWWLRLALLSLGFTVLQKSVWVGRKKIPQEFLEDLRLRKMLSYIHIFEVRKSGTLKEIG
ncbi:MAG: hypothetical protein Q7R94_01060 [bacterium]|nr:hypothetical protein [bacterium]